MAVVEQLQAQGLAKAVIACDSSEAKRGEVLERFGLSTFSTDFRDVVESDEVDLVMVLTPDLWHGPISQAALEAGKHVLVEKPMFLVLDETGQALDLDKTLATAVRLVALAKKGPGYLACAPFVILSETFQLIRNHIRVGHLGKVCQARARYGSRMPGHTWAYQPGGGPLFNIAIYNLTTLTGLLGPAQRVTAMMGVALPEREVGGEKVQFGAEEDNAQILLDFGDSVLAAITTGWTMFQYRSPAIELYGSKGVIQLLGDDWAPNGYELWQSGSEGWQTFPEKNRAWRWADGLRHFVHCIHRQTPPTAMLDHAFHVLEIILKAKAAAKSGQTQRIESRFSLTDLP
jgi:predicted dehydrogenase